MLLSLLTVSLPVPAQTAVELAELGEDARSYIGASRSENTNRAYRTGWNQFEGWCDRHGQQSLPAKPETVALYVTELASKAKPATIDSRLAAISAAHRAAGHDSPTKSEPVRLVRRGVRRTLGTAQREARPVLVEDLRAMVAELPDTAIGDRDRALLLLGSPGLCDVRNSSGSM